MGQTLQSAVLNWGNEFEESNSVSCRGSSVPLKKLQDINVKRKYNFEDETTVYLIEILHDRKKI